MVRCALSLLTFAALCATLVGCDRAADSAGTEPDAGAAGASSPTNGCNDARQPGSVCVESVHARVLDESGAALPDLLATVCGAICYQGTTDSDGRVSVPVGTNLLLADYAFPAHARPTFSSFYFPLPTTPTGPVLELGDKIVLRMPATGPLLVVATDSAPAQTVVSGDVTLAVPDGVEVALAIDDVLLQDTGKQFRALTVPPSRWGDYGAGDLNLFAVYAFTPFDASFRVPATHVPAGVALSVANTTGLAAGTAVEVLALGSYLFPEWVKPAMWDVVATAQVDSTGAAIEVAAATGLEHLTWIGLRVAPVQ